MLLEKVYFQDAWRHLKQQVQGNKKGNKICDFNFSDQFSKGWNWTWQVPRADFDQILTDDLMKSGVEVLFETTVKDILFDGTNSITTVEQENGSSSKIHARFIIDASGYGRVIPKLFNLDRPSDLPARKTLFTHIRDTRRMDYDEPNRITIVSQVVQNKCSEL